MSNVMASTCEPSRWRLPRSRASISIDVVDFICKRGDLALAIGIMAILVVLILPLPTWLLDVCLAFRSPSRS